MDLSSILSELLTPDPGADVANAPDPGAGGSLLPSLPMGGAAPIPMAPQGSMHPAIPMPPAVSHGSGAGDMIRNLAPLLVAAVTGFKNPLHGAAIAHGAFAGAQMAQQENLATEERAQQQRQLASKFMQQTAIDVLRLKDPLDRQNYLQLADQIGTTEFNMPKGWTQKIPGHDAGSDVFGAMKTELAGKLTAFDKDKRWADVAGTPAEAKISFKLSNGQSVPVNMARQLVGQALYDSSGAQAFATPPVEGKTVDERLANLSLGIQTAKARGDTATATKLKSQYDATLQAKWDMEKPASDAKLGTFEDYVNRKFGPDPTPQQIETARRTWGDEGRQAPVTLQIPGLTDMTPADRVETAARSLLDGTMAPSQLATFFKGMGQNSASQLTSLVMQRVKQIRPDFSFAAAESNYTFGKNVGVQQQVRFSKSVQESIPLLIDQANKLANGNIRSVNALVNAGKNQFNDIDLKKFQTTSMLVADEIAKILQGGGTGSGTSDAKLKQAQTIISTSDSPKAIAAALDTVNQLIGFRIDAQTKGTFMAAPDSAPSSAAKVRFNPATGKLEPIK